MFTSSISSELKTEYSQFPSYSRHVTANTAYGRTRTFAGLSILEWAFLVVSFVNIIVNAVLSAYHFCQVIKVDSATPAFTFAILVLLNLAFCNIYVVHGILREKEFEIYAYIAASLVVLTYCVLDYIFNTSDRSTIKLIRLIACGLLVPLSVCLAILVANKFGWLEFKIVGASETMQFMYRESSRFTSLLKFDLQATLTFLLLVLRHGTDVGLIQGLILGIGTLYSIAWVIVGWSAMRNELLAAASIFGVAGLVMVTYAMLYIAWIYMEFYPNLSDNDEWRLNYLTFIAGAAFFTVRFLLFYELYRVCRNFGQGLKERAFDIDERTSLLAIPSRRQ